MSVFIDTSVWSLALRRDTVPEDRAVHAFESIFSSGDDVFATGIVLQEILQGLAGPKQKETLMGQFSSITLLTPDRNDHVEAAEIRNLCRRSGIQIGTIDALIAQLCIRHESQLLTTDRDFVHAARHVPLKLYLS